MPSRSRSREAETIEEKVFTTTDELDQAINKLT